HVLSMVAEHGNQLRLALAGIAGETEFFRTRAKLLNGPVVVVTCLSAAPADSSAAISCCGIRYSCRLLLRIAVITKLFVELRIFEAVATTCSWHGFLLRV